MIRVGRHPPDVAWGYTPRQLAGWVSFISAGEARDRAADLHIGALASRGDPKDIKATLKKLEGG